MQSLREGRDLVSKQGESIIRNASKLQELEEQEAALIEAQARQGSELVDLRDRTEGRQVLCRLGLCFPLSPPLSSHTSSRVSSTTLDMTESRSCSNGSSRAGRGSRRKSRASRSSRGRG